MDTCGSVPCWSSTPGWHPAWPRHEYSGAPGWGGFDKVDLPPEEQWMYQAMAAVLRATALLRNMPEVERNQIGIAGISWGGYLALSASSITPEETYRFAIPVYASTHFTDYPTSTVAPETVTDEQVRKWTQMWDPAPAVARTTTPTLFLSDAEDVAFNLPTWQKTTELPAQKYIQRSLRIHYSHNHERSMYSCTEAVFADAVLRKKQLPRWGMIQNDGGEIRASLEMNGRRIVNCELCYTRAEGFWADRRWTAVPVKITEKQVKAILPRYTTAAFFSVTDEGDCIWTSPVFISK